MTSRYIEMPVFEVVAWAVVCALLLCGGAWLINQERRRFRRIGKGRSWAWLRLMSVPILALTVGSVFLIARFASGMEALAYFYVALFSVGPLVWFGLHVAVGRLLSPGLSTGESTIVALLGITLIVVPLAVVGAFQTPVFTASRAWSERAFSRAESTALAHRVAPVRRFSLGAVGDIYAVALFAPPDVALERVDVLLGDTWQDTAHVTHEDLCRQRDDLYLTWTADSAPSPLRLYWRDRDGARHQADFRVESAAAAQTPAEAFDVVWRTDGLDLPIPVARERLQLGWYRGGNRLNYRSLDMLQPGETFRDDCVMSGYRRVAWQEEGAIDAAMLIFRPASGGLWRYEAKRPD